MATARRSHEVVLDLHGGTVEMLGSDGRDLLLDAVFRNVETGLCLLSDVGVVLRANDLWLHSMQLTAESTIGRALSTNAPERATLILDAAAQSAGAAVLLPGRPRSEGGVWEERLTRLDASGGALLLLSVQARVEPAPLARANEPSYGATFENIHDAVALLEAIRDPAGNVIDWLCFDANEAVAGQMKLSRDEVVGKRLSELFPERFSTVSAGYAQVLSTGEAWRYEARVGISDYLIKAFRIDADRIGSTAFDVTSIRIAEASLRRNERHLRQLIEHTPAGVALLDRNLRYLTASRRWATDFGVDYDSLLGRSHYEVFPEISERWREIHRRCLAGASERCAEDPFPRADGRMDWVEWEVQPWRESDGTIGGLFIFAVLISERKQAADRLLAAKERLAVTLSSIGDAVIATDESNRITLLNRVAEELTGWSSEEALQKPLDDVYRIVNEDTGERLPSPAERVLREGVIIGGGTHTDLIARGGRRRPIADSAAPIRDAAGRIVGVVLVFRDQSGVRSAELALTRSRAELSALIEKLPIGVFVCERKEIVYANPTFSEYCGRSPAELIGHKLAELAAPGAPESPEEGSEWEVRGPHGRSVTLACSPVRAIEFEGRPADLWTCRDLSPLKAMQAQLIHTDRLATVGMLAAGVAHEINNPLAYMLVALELIDESLQRMATALPKSELLETFDSLRDARSGAQRVKAIVGELKAFSRADQDERITLDLRKLLESAVAMATNEIKPRARLVRSFEAAPCVVGNEARLGQVFLNLLVNAAHAIPEGHAEDNEIRVVLRTDSHGRAVVEVLDTGTGIAPEVLDRIFAPFFTTKAGSGTGLGLAISRSTIDALGGEITVENRPERGAIARVTLLPGQVDRKTTPDVPTELDAPRSREVHVLVVDDELAICKTFHRLLKGHDVTTESNARDAWARIERGERFDVIFCDVMMPGMSGMEFYQCVQSAVPEQAERFVFMTGGTFTQSAAEFLGGVRNLRLDKPFDGHQVRQLVSQSAPVAAAVPARAVGMRRSH